MTPEDLAADRQLLSWLRAARSWGVSPSVFVGGERATRYEYNDRGQVVRSVAEGWSDWDRSAALALVEFEKSLCPGCAGDLSETTKPENEFGYDASEVLRCHRCVALDQARAPFKDDPHPGSLLIGVELRRSVAGDDAVVDGG